MTEALISLQNVGKQFSKGMEHGHRTLGHELLALFLGARAPAAQDDPQAFWALQGIDLEVRRGEALGVIGHNGAGKTTLLRLLNGEFAHDVGELAVHGQRASLIDLTGGFSSTMSGRENIYFRGAHLGFDHAFLRSKEAEIVAFTELGDFIDSPIKTYSSGMLLRLGFAVTVLAEPDVLLVDEILSVGDFLFAAKCMRKMNELKRRAAIVQVSHSMEEIVHFADKVLVLDRGKPVFLGEPPKAVAHYMKLEEAKAKAGGSRLSRALVATAPSESLEEDEAPVDESAPLPNEPGEEDSAVLAAKMGQFFLNPDALKDVQIEWRTSEGDLATEYRGDEPVFLAVSFTALEPIHRLAVGVPIWTREGVYITCCATHGRPIVHAVQAGKRHRITLDISALTFNKGVYYPVIAILNGGEFLYRQPGPLLRVTSNRAVMGWGLVTLDYGWRQECVSKVTQERELHDRPIPR